MLVLFSGSGSGEFTVESTVPVEQGRTFIANAARVLRSRGETRAAEILAGSRLQIHRGANPFDDDFTVLWAKLPLAEYERVRQTLDVERPQYRKIAHVLSEIGPYIRFIAVDLALDADAGTTDARRLSSGEVHKLVYNYIGVNGGYLGDFSYQSHHQFYLELDLSINPYEYAGTTRARFTEILSGSPPDVQAKILDGILRKYPVGSAEQRTQQRHEEVRGWIARLHGAAPVATPDLRISSAVVERALRDAEQLLQTSGATSGVDRAHTALHGYLLAVCSGSGIDAAGDATLTDLFKLLRERHPALQTAGPRAGDITRVLRSMSTILDALNPLRNRASVAHPNPELLPAPEAMLVINTVRTLLHYLDAKLQSIARVEHARRGAARADPPGR